MLWQSYTKTLFVCVSMNNNNKIFINCRFLFIINHILRFLPRMTKQFFNSNFFCQGFPDDDPRRTPFSDCHPSSGNDRVSRRFDRFARRVRNGGRRLSWQTSRRTTSAGGEQELLLRRRTEQQRSFHEDFGGMFTSTLGSVIYIQFCSQTLLTIKVITNSRQVIDEQI